MTRMSWLLAMTAVRMRQVGPIIELERIRAR